MYRDPSPDADHKCNNCAWRAYMADMSFTVIRFGSDKTQLKCQFCGRLFLFKTILLTDAECPDCEE